MAWRDRLSTQLFGLIAAASVVVVSAFALAEQALQRQLVRGVVEETGLLAATVRNTILRSMLLDRRADAYLVMEDVARQPGIEKVRMFDKQGHITFSTDRTEIGRQVERTAESCNACHDAGPARTEASNEGRSRIFTSGGHRVLAVMTAVHNDVSCSTAACHAHAPEQKLLGVVDVAVSLERMDGETAAFRWRVLVAAGAVVAALSGAAFLYLKFKVLRPVAALVEATRRVAQERLDLEVPEAWRGELGLLGSSFNDMTRSLRGSRQQLDAVMSGLERLVEERTASLRAAQDQLVRTEKLTSLGKLSASIAHEINNPLAGILTFARLTVRTLEQGTPDEGSRRVMVKNLLLVQRETERCSAIVRNLLDFARERQLTVKELSPNMVVEEGLSLLGNQIQLQGLAVERRLGDLPHIEGDFGLLRQAFVNVVMNACEAMPAGGKLTVETRRSEDGVEIAVQDTGPGIPPEVMKRIFDPFFTTKERGTGLGLSVVYGIVERHGGRVDVASEPGRGARFALWLPVRRTGEARA